MATTLKATDYITFLLSQKVLLHRDDLEQCYYIVIEFITKPLFQIIKHKKVNVIKFHAKFY